jgi:hypothetical protein
MIGVANPGAATRRIALLCLVLALPWSGGVSQQVGGHNAGLPPSVFQPQTQVPFGTDPVMSPEAAKRLNMINAARQKGLVADTNKLLALATELNHEIAKSNPGELSADQMRKVAEIEKLAHSVRDKMVMPIRNPALNMDDSPYSPFAH